MSNAYWKSRAVQNETRAQAIAKELSKHLKTLHNGTYKSLKADLDALDVAVKAGETLTRSELWRTKEYLKLINDIKAQCDGIAQAEIDALTDELGKVFETTIGAALEQVKAFPTVTSDQLKERLLKSAWSGSNYSSRIWTNTTALAEKLQKHITDYIMTGKDARKVLMRDLSVSYRQADRIVRTETAYITTQASIEAYREADIEEVEYIHNCDGGCEECKQYDGRIFPINHAPLLPIHPNCVCCYAPVIKKNVVK